MTLFTGLALAADLPAYIREGHVDVLRTWFAAHPGQRLAIDQDCQCSDDIEELRWGDGGAWTPQPNFHPYYAVGDFDGDGFDDIAVVALPYKDGDKILVVVLFGSEAGLTGNATVIPEEGKSVVDRGLFLARPNRRSSLRHPVLLFGTFGSEAEPVPIRRGQSAKGGQA